MQYRISSTAWREALTGTRVRGLLHEPPPIQYTRSSTQPIPTLAEERDVTLSGWCFQWPIQYRLLPKNISHEMKMNIMYRQRQDLHQRFVEKIEPDSASVWEPLLVLKPVATSYGGLYQKQWGYRHPQKQVVGERLGGRGFGWRKRLPQFWQLSHDHFVYTHNRSY